MDIFHSWEYILRFPKYQFKTVYYYAVLCSQQCYLQQPRSGQTLFSFIRFDLYLVLLNGSTFNDLIISASCQNCNANCYKKGGHYISSFREEFCLEHKILVCDFFPHQLTVLSSRWTPLCTPRGFLFPLIKCSLNL